MNQDRFSTLYGLLIRLTREDKIIWSHISGRYVCWRNDCKDEISIELYTERVADLPVKYMRLTVRHAQELIADETKCIGGDAYAPWKELLDVVQGQTKARHRGFFTALLDDLNSIE